MLMAQISSSSTAEVSKDTARLKWLRAMYVANIVIALPLGLGVLLAPEGMRGVMGVTGGEPIFYGMAAGAVPLAFGLVGLLGLRFPLTLSPVLALQALYKSLFLIGVILPLFVIGQLPTFAVSLSVLFVLFIVGDLIAVPFSHLLSRKAGVS